MREIITHAILIQAFKQQCYTHSTLLLTPRLFIFFFSRRIIRYSVVQHCTCLFNVTFHDTNLPSKDSKMHNFTLQTRIKLSIFIFPRHVRREKVCKNNIVWHLYNKMEATFPYHELIFFLQSLKVKSFKLISIIVKKKKVYLILVLFFFKVSQ